MCKQSNAPKVEPPTLKNQRKPTLPRKGKCAHFLLNSGTMLITADHSWSQLIKCGHGWAVVLWDIIEDTIPAATTAISNSLKFIVTPLFTIVLWRSVANTFPYPFPIFPWRLPVPENCPCGFVDSWRFTLGPVGSIRHMGLTISHRFNGPRPVQTIQKIICEVDLPSNVIRHAFQHPQLCIALWVVPPEKGGRKVQHGALKHLKQQWCSDMQWCTSHCLFRNETPGVS